LKKRSKKLLFKKGQIPLVANPGAGESKKDQPYEIASVVGSLVMARDTAKPEDIATLYHRAFAEFGNVALWSSRPVTAPCDTMLAYYDKKPDA